MEDPGTIRNLHVLKLGIYVCTYLSKPKTESSEFSIVFRNHCSIPKNKTLPVLEI